MVDTTRSQEDICRVVKVETLQLQTQSNRRPDYNGVLVTEDTLLVIDYKACNLQFYSRRDGRMLSTSHRLESVPRGICLINKTEVTVYLEDSTILILSFKYIDDVKLVKTLHVNTGFTWCHSVAKLNSTYKLVVSGWKYRMLYWCVVNLEDGRVDSTHKICKGYGSTHLAIKDNNLYISCRSFDSTVRGVYAYDIFNPHTRKFMYKYHERTPSSTKWTPWSIMVDRRNSIFVCDRNSNSIHQLTESGQLVTIHTVSSRPYEIFYDDQHGVLYTTSMDSNVIDIYRLEYLHQSAKFGNSGIKYEDNGIPIEILKMDHRSIQLFEEALKDGEETVHSIRIMVVGHMGVGKTTLVKRLLGEEVNISNRCSTEGIDVYVNCCDVSLITREWSRRIKDSDQDYRLQRLARVLNEQPSTRKKVTDEEFMQCRLARVPKEQHSMEDRVTENEQLIIPPQGERTVKSHEMTRTVVEDNVTDVLYRRSSQEEFVQSRSSTASQQEESTLALADKTVEQPDTSTMAMLKLLHANADNIKQDTGKTSSLTMWDFAGQFAFYTTHQTFLTRRAIYLLVSDVSEQLNDLVDDECYFDSEGMMKCKVHELIEVWLNSIHSCAPFPASGIPPVILVGTHVDKISQKKSVAKQRELERQATTSKREEFTLPVTSTHAATVTKEKPRTSIFLGSVKETKRIVDASPDFGIAGAHALSTADQPKTQRKLSFRQWIKEKKKIRADAKKRYRHEICERYFRAIRTRLSDLPTRFHLVDEDFAIDNTVLDSRLEDLKRKIVEVASQQSYWGEQIPARWLPLEQELMRRKAAGIKVITRRLLEDLNQEGAVPLATEELDLFLRFQHDIGIMLYFSMDVLREKIVLDPQWLIDALKSLITADEMFILRNRKSVTDKWFDFKAKGKLTPELIDAIWTMEKKPDFHDNKEHLLLLMEHLNIITKPKSYVEDGNAIKEEDYYLAPCMLRQATPKEIISPEPDPEMESTSVLCFMCTGKFLPPPIFHRLVGACLTYWPIAKRRSENLIYCGCCVVDLDHHHRLTLHFRDYFIFARVTRMGVKDTTLTSELCSQAREVISENLSKILGNLGQTLQFDTYIKCPDYDADGPEGLFALSLLQKNENVVCHSHDKSHTLVSRQLLQYWFKEEGKEDGPQQQQEMEKRESSGSENFQDEEDRDNVDTPITQEHINHARLCNAMTTVCADALREILVSQVPVPYANIYQAILAKQDHLTSRRLLNNDQIDVVFPDLLERFTGTVDQFDISLLYTIIRSVSSVSVPTTGWGNPPADQPRDASLGASVERIRIFRNKISGHSVDGKISETEFKNYWQSIEAVLCDIEIIIGDHGYQGELEKRRNQVITPHEAREQRQKIRAYIKAVKEKIVLDLDAIAEATNA